MCVYISIPARARPLLLFVSRALHTLVMNERRRHWRCRRITN